MTEQDVIKAYTKIRTIDNKIPDDVLDFMKNASIKQLRLNSVSHRRELLLDFFNWYENNQKEKSNNKTIVDAYLEDN